jgi:hypothetical protein
MKLLPPMPQIAIFVLALFVSAIYPITSGDAEELQSFGKDSTKIEPSPERLLFAHTALINDHTTVQASAGMLLVFSQDFAGFDFIFRLGASLFDKLYVETSYFEFAPDNRSELPLRAGFHYSVHSSEDHHIAVGYQYVNSESFDVHSMFGVYSWTPGNNIYNIGLGGGGWPEKNRAGTLVSVGGSWSLGANTYFILDISIMSGCHDLGTGWFLSGLRFTGKHFMLEFGTLLFVQNTLTLSYIY